MQMRPSKTHLIPVPRLDIACHRHTCSGAAAGWSPGCRRARCGRCACAGPLRTPLGTTDGTTPSPCSRPAPQAENSQQHRLYARSHTDPVGTGCCARSAAGSMKGRNAASPFQNAHHDSVRQVRCQPRHVLPQERQVHMDTATCTVGFRVYPKPSTQVDRPNACLAIEGVVSTVIIETCAVHQKSAGDSAPVQASAECGIPYLPDGDGWCHLCTAARRPAPAPLHPASSRQCQQLWPC